MLVAALVAVVVSLLLPSRVDEAGSAAVDCMFGPDCDVVASDDPDAGAEGPSDPTSSTTDPGPSPTDPGPAPDASADDAPGEGPADAEAPDDAPALDDVPAGEDATDADAAADSSPSPTQVAADGGGGSDPHEQTTDILAETDVGQEFLDQLEEHPIDLDYVDGQGAWWNGDMIQIDSSWDPDDMAATLIHELTHDQMGRIEGDRPHPDHYDDREAYLEAMADFEVQAMLNEIRFYDELGEVRDDHEATSREQMYARMYEELAQEAYDEAYERWLDADRVTVLGTEFVFGSDEQREAFARLQAERAREQAMYDALMAEFLDGHLQGSNSGRAYVDVWDDRWDDAQSCGFLWHRCW